MIEPPRNNETTKTTTTTTKEEEEEENKSRNRRINANIRYISTDRLPTSYVTNFSSACFLGGVQSISFVRLDHFVRSFQLS